MILIVESGATKTDWCLVAPGGRVEKRLQTPGMNLSTIAAEANAQVFADAVENFSGVEEVHFFAAGLLEFPTGLDRVFRERFPRATFEYASDLLAAARANLMMMLTWCTCSSSLNVCPVFFILRHRA